MKNLENIVDIKNLKNIVEGSGFPSFYEDDNGKRFFIVGGLSNETLINSFDVKLIDDIDYDDLGEEIGATKKGKYYERSELVKRLRELGYQAISVTTDREEEWWIDKCDDDYRSYEEDSYEAILYATKNIDLENYIKLFNLNGAHCFVRIFTSDWRASEVVPWAMRHSQEDANYSLSSYAIKELDRLGIKVQKAYKELKWSK